MKAEPCRRRCSEVGSGAQVCLGEAGRGGSETSKRADGCETGRFRIAFIYGNGAVTLSERNALLILRFYGIGTHQSGTGTKSGCTSVGL